MKTVVISGASSGIGKEMVKVFSQKDWRVLMIARNEERLKKIKSDHKNVDYVICDLASTEDLDFLQKQITNEPFAVHALINNAGVYRPQTIDKDKDSTWETHFQNNLMSAVRLNRLFWDNLKETKGCVLNISSTLGIRPIANTAAYSALKAAMNNWTLSLAMEGAPFGVRANGICPGIVDTPIHSYFESNKPQEQELYEQLQKAQPIGRTGKPQDIATMAYHLCQDEAQWTTGAIINVDGGILLNS